MSIHVAIVENDQRASGVLARRINATAGFHCTGLHSNLADALDEFPVSLPEAVLRDIQLPGGNGVEGVRRIKEAGPARHILVLTDLNDPQIVFKALAAGASGYLLKNGSSPVQIIGAIREVFHGGAPLTGSIARRLVNLFQEAAPVPVPDYRKLSLREHQVLDLLARGLRYKEVAFKLNISYATVHSHIRHIYKKLRVSCRTDAVMLYLRQSPDWRIAAPEPQSGLIPKFAGAKPTEDFPRSQVQATNGLVDWNH
jgi:DNA-binding NarL/FixJ family response regulator